MQEQIHIETEVSFQKVEIPAIKDMLTKLDYKFDGMQAFMSKLYEVFVTQKEMQKAVDDSDKEHDDIWRAIKENEKETKNLTVRAAFISGIGFFAVLLKDVIITAVTNNFKS